MQVTWVQSLDQEDLMEKEMATHSSVLAWRILWTEEPDRVANKSDPTERLTRLTFQSCGPRALEHRPSSCRAWA